MAALSHRLVGAALVLAAALGASVASTSAAYAAPAGSTNSTISPTEVQTFFGTGASVGQAFNIALAQATAAGYTSSQCTSRVISLGGGFWEVDLTCRR